MQCLYFLHCSIHLRLYFLWPNLHLSQSLFHFAWPPVVILIGNKWVYIIKINSDGTIERCKDLVVAKGYTQTEGLYYFDTFSLVAKITTFRLVLALASINKWNLHQLNVNNSFFHGTLQETVYMVVPPDITTSKPNQVCELLKSLYGLKQTNRKWFERLTALIIQCGYLQASSYHSLFIKKNHIAITTLIVYMDDIVLMVTSLDEFTSLSNKLYMRLSIWGFLKIFFGLEVAYSMQPFPFLNDSIALIGCKPCSFNSFGLCYSSSSWWQCFLSQCTRIRKVHRPTLMLRKNLKSNVLNINK